MSDDLQRTERSDGAGGEGGGEQEEIPFGQRMLDRPFPLLVACIVIMFVFYTIWGMVEIASLSDAPLP